MIWLVNLLVNTLAYMVWPIWNEKFFFLRSKSKFIVAHMASNVSNTCPCNCNVKMLMFLKIVKALICLGLLPLANLTSDIAYTCMTQYVSISIVWCVTTVARSLLSICLGPADCLFAPSTVFCDCRTLSTNCFIVILCPGENFLLLKLGAVN